MMKFSEEILNAYSKPISETEEQKCKNALKMVSSALQKIGYGENSEGIETYVDDTMSFSLHMSKWISSTNETRKIKLLVQGSYANNTNIRQDSDVDIAVILESTFIPIFRTNQSNTDYGFTDGTYSSIQLKNDVLLALTTKFSNGVIRNNKSIKVSGNSYRVDADVVPCSRLRDYSCGYTNDQNDYVGGIRIFPDYGSYIDNYPEQHIQNGKEKNVNTNYMYKKMVRIIKNIKKLMIDSGYDSANKMNSFGLESLLWNVTNKEFLKYTSKKYIFKSIVNYLFSDKYLFALYKEVNGVKKLCDSTTLSDYQNFATDLKGFYQYE